MASGWAYVGCADFATGSGPTGSVQFHTHGTSIDGSAYFMFHTASVYHGAANTLVLSGNMVITGSLSASVIKYENITVIDSTGSTFFGNTNDDVHARTGSLRASTLSTPVFWATASANGAIPYVGIGTIGAIATLQVQGGSATAVPTLLVDHDDDNVVGVDINLANTTAIGIDIDASNTTAAVLDITANALTTGTALNISTTATNNSAGALVKIAQSGDRAGDAASIGLDIDFDTGAAANARAFRIDSEQTTGIVAELSADALTTGKGVNVTSTSNGLSGANLLYANASGTSTSAYSVAKIVKDHANLSDSNAIVGLDIDFDGTAGTAGRAFRIDSEQTTGIVAEIDGNALTTGVALDVSTSALTTGGRAVYIGDNSSDTGTRNSVQIVQDHASATGATALTVQSDGGNTGVLLDKNASGVAAQDATGLYIDFVRTVAASGTAAHNDIGIHLDVTSRSKGTSTVVGHDVTVTGHTDGTHTATGMELTTTGADTNNGLIINCADGGTDFKAVSSADTGDFFSITTTTHGATTLATVDDDSNDDADLTLDADGKIVVEAKAGDEAVFNEGGLDVDFRVESVDETHMLFVDGANNRVGIGDSVSAPGATLAVQNHASAGAYNRPLVQLTSNDLDQQTLDIDASTTTANVIDVAASSTTSGMVLNLESTSLTAGRLIHANDNSADTTARQTVLIKQNHISAIAATALKVQSDGGITGIDLDKNFSDTTAATVTGLSVDLDKTGTSTSNNTIYGINIDVDNTTATNGTNTMYGIHCTPTLTHAADAGTPIVYGALINAQGGTNGAAIAQAARFEAGGADINYGIQLDVEDGGVDLRIESSADNGDYFQIQTTTHGATTITTVDDNAAAANLAFTVDGTITQTAVGLIKLDGAGVEVENASASGAPALLIDNDDTDEVALSIDAANIDANVVDIGADAVTTANAVKISVDDCLTTGKALFIDHNDGAIGAVTPTTLHIDFDKDGVTANSTTSAFIGIDLDMNDDATNHAGSNVTMTGLDIDVDSASNQGTNTNVGIDLTVIDATTNDGIRIVAENGAGADLKMISSADAEDYCTIAVGAAGATTITTVDHAAAAANIQITADGTAELAGTTVTLDSGGDIVLSADGDNITMDNGTTTVFDFAVDTTPTLKIMDDAQVANYFSIGVGANGETTITTVDTDAAVAHLNFAVDGDIILGPGGGDVLPDGDGTRNLGSGAKRWANIYTADLHLANDRGDWTVIEEENYLTIRSNKTGKRFKLLMEEIED